MTLSYRYERTSSDGTHLIYTKTATGATATTTDALGDTTHLTYDQAGHLTAVTDPYGNTTTWSYADAENSTGSNSEGGTNSASEINDSGNIETGGSGSSGNNSGTNSDGPGTGGVQLYDIFAGLIPGAPPATDTPPPRPSTIQCHSPPVDRPGFTLGLNQLFPPTAPTPKTPEPIQQPGMHASAPGTVATILGRRYEWSNIHGDWLILDEQTNRFRPMTPSEETTFRGGALGAQLVNGVREEGVWGGAKAVLQPNGVWENIAPALMRPGRGATGQKLTPEQLAYLQRNLSPNIAGPAVGLPPPQSRGVPLDGGPLRFIASDGREFQTVDELIKYEKGLRKGPLLALPPFSGTAPEKPLPSGIESDILSTIRGSSPYPGSCATTAKDIAIRIRGLHPGKWLQIDTTGGDLIVTGDGARLPAGEAVGGGHTAIEINGKIYDNVHQNGIPREEWLSGLKVRMKDGKTISLGDYIKLGLANVKVFDI